MRKYFVACFPFEFAFMIGVTRLNQHSSFLVTPLRHNTPQGHSGKPERDKEILLVMIADSKTELIITETKNGIKIFVQKTKIAQSSSVTWDPNKMVCTIVLSADMGLFQSETIQS
jgi:hypothetical protein